MARSAPSASAMPRVSVVFPAALSPAMASMTGRGGSGAASLRRRRIILSGTVLSPPRHSGLGLTCYLGRFWAATDELPPYGRRNKGASPRLGNPRGRRPAGGRRNAVHRVQIQGL